jgi:hypothetical protein
MMTSFKKNIRFVVTPLQMGCDRETDRSVPHEGGDHDGNHGGDYL